jgi:hypothetical protein
LKKDYDYSSQITTLPITNTLREEKREPSPKRTNSVKEKYDYSSAIPTLPGYFNKRPDSRDPPQKPKEELIKRFALTTEEIIQIVSQILIDSNLFRKENLKSTSLPEPTRTKLAKASLMYPLVYFILISSSLSSLILSASP